MLSLAGHRLSWLTEAALDITSLGSNTVELLVSASTVALLVSSRKYAATVQLVAAAAGSNILIPLAKSMFERARPPVAERLTEASGFSFPSGHALSAAAVYLTIAWIASRSAERRCRLAIFGVAGVVIVLVAASRVYLAVHYPSDVLGGLSLGSAWALALAAFFTARFGTAKTIG